MRHLESGVTRQHEEADLPMSADRLERASPRYDAFVVRLWRGAVRDQLVRAEVEHVGSGARVRAVAVPTAWVLRQILAHLGATPTQDAADDGRPTIDTAAP
jgi:hypothetical protein